MEGLRMKSVRVTGRGAAVQFGGQMELAVAPGAGATDHSFGDLQFFSHALGAKFAIGLRQGTIAYSVGAQRCVVRIGRSASWNAADQVSEVRVRVSETSGKRRSSRLR